MTNTHESIINDDGGLSLRVPTDKVTWYSFLSAARAANSTEGGWNHKSHWVHRGLERMIHNNAAADFVSTWTKSSLARKAEPAPREKDFQFRLRNDALIAGFRGKHGMPKPDSENCLNWNLSCTLFEARCKNADHAQVMFELPLAARSEGQLKADVVFFGENGLVEIVELKKSREGGDPDTPLMALVEGICYTLQLLRCWEWLKTELHDGFSKSDAPTTIHLIVAGPGYWRGCHPKSGDITDEQIRWLHAIVAGVAKDLPLFGKTRPKLLLTLADVATGKDRRVSLKAEPSSLCQSALPEGSIVVS